MSLSHLFARERILRMVASERGLVEHRLVAADEGPVAGLDESHLILGEPAQF